MVPPRSPPTRSRPKTALFCQVCAHESPVDGDWDRTHQKRASRVDYHCPECGHLVTSRPVDGRGLEFEFESESENENGNENDDPRDDTDADTNTDADRSEDDDSLERVVNA